MSQMCLLTQVDRQLWSSYSRMDNTCNNHPGLRWCCCNNDWQLRGERWRQRGINQTNKSKSLPSEERKYCVYCNTVILQIQHRPLKTEVTVSKDRSTSVTQTHTHTHTLKSHLCLWSDTSVDICSSDLWPAPPLLKATPPDVIMNHFSWWLAEGVDLLWR